MTITYTIPGTTLLDQLSEPTADGLPDENANDNCVPASLAEALHILTGAAYDGDQLKDAVYGQGWTGFQSASAYVKYCADRGVSLSAHDDSQAGLVATLHSEVAAGHPVLVTMPSQWGTAPADPVYPVGSTHVGVAVGVGPGLIRVMNPWHGFYQDQPDDWWAARLCYGQVWPLRKVSTNAMGITRNADGSATDASNGLSVGSGIAGYIFAQGYQGADLLTGEVPFVNGGQHESACALSNGHVVRWYGNGADENSAAVMCGLMGATDAAVKAGQAQAAQLQAQLSAANDHLTTAQTLIASLQAQLAAAQAATQNANAGVFAQAIDALKAALAQA